MDVPGPVAQWLERRSGLTVPGGPWSSGTSLLHNVILAAMARTGCARVLVSGNTSPAIVAALAGGGGDALMDVLDPDPLGFENLVGAVDPDLAAVVVENPGLFGGWRDLTGVASECRAWDVPLVLVTTQPGSLDLVDILPHACPDILVVQGADWSALAAVPAWVEALAPWLSGLASVPASPPDGAQAVRRNQLAERLHRLLRPLPGMQVFPTDPIQACTLYLGDHVDGWDFQDTLTIEGGPKVRAVARLFPAYVELRPLLILDVGPDTTESGIERFRDVVSKLGLEPKRLDR